MFFASRGALTAPLRIQTWWLTLFCLISASVILLTYYNFHSLQLLYCTSMSGLVAVNERSSDGGPVLDAMSEETVAHVQLDVLIVFGGIDLEERGTLYITTKRLVWLTPSEPHKGYAVDFLSLTMHAISRDSEAYPRPCIYTQIENGEDDDDEWEEDGEEEGGGATYMDAEGGGGAEVGQVAGAEEGHLSLVSEMRLVPQDPATLDVLFQVLCECAALNPDPHGAEQEGEGDFVFDVDTMNGGGTNVGANATVDDSRELDLQDEDVYEDAEEEEEDEEASSALREPSAPL